MDIPLDATGKSTLNPSLPPRFAGSSRYRCPSFEICTTMFDGVEPACLTNIGLTEPRSASLLSIACQRDGKNVAPLLAIPLRAMTSSLSWCVEPPPPVRLPVATYRLLPSDAMPPAAQIPSPCPAVAQPVTLSGLAVWMATTRPWYAPQ